MSTTNSMHQIAANAPVGDVRVASEYFSRRQLHRRNRIVESAQVPTTRIAGILYARDGSGTEALNGRLIEIPESLERHELHDPTVRYITYVPPGSLARGRRLVQTGPAGPTTACSACHGPDLLGVAMVPPIAGRSPSYILRQLLNIKTGARRDSASVPMRAVVEPLSLDDIVALAAYVGSLAPNRPR
ncbi:MAG: c-type cytochrome [Gemmatimonadaceae bacterium]